MVHGTPTVHSSVQSTPTPAAPPEPTQVYEPAPAPTAFGDGFRSDTAATEDDAPDEAWDAGLDEPTSDFAEEEAAFNPEPAEELPPAEPAPLEEPAMQPEVDPADPPAEDDLFGDGGFNDATFGDEPAEPAEEAPAEDDLFGDGGFGDEPAEGPMPEDSGDLFGAEETPAEEPAAGDDDLFGDSGFGDEPAEEPAEEPMPEDSGDLFGDDFGDDAAPAEEPAEEDDLFGDDAGFGEDTPADDFFGEEPAEQPAAEEAPAEEAPADDAEGDLFDFGGDAEGDDLFDPAPADDAGAPAADDAEADLFDLGTILQEPGGTHSSHDRTWVDDTGRYSTVGRLIAVDGGSIRLAKPNGGVATVPLGRLSQRDLEFVSRQALAMNQARDAAIARGERPDDAPKQAKAADTILPLRTAQL